MRINLVTPFAEKDAVKALGARWDSAKRTWYITEVADLAPFMRWIPDIAYQRQDASGGTVTTRSGFQATPAPAPAGTVTAPRKAVLHCGCTVLPWEPCTHG